MKSNSEKRWRSAPPPYQGGSVSGPLNVAAHPAEGQETGQEGPPRAYSRLVLVNSWTVSLVVHLALLVLLSLVTYTIRTGSQLEITLGDASSLQADFSIEAPGVEDQLGTDLDSQMQQMLAAANQMPELEFNSELVKIEPSLSLLDLTGVNQQNSNSKSGGKADNDEYFGKGVAASFFGLQATGKRFVFIVDSSSSMSGRRWKNAVNELVASIQSLQSNQQFYIIFFDSRTHLMFQGRVDKYRKSRRLKMIHATQDNVARVQRWVNGLDLGSDTRPRISFDYGLSLDPDAIFFLTDGEFSDGTFEFLMRVAAQSESKPAIHTVAFGLNSPFSNGTSETLEKIADRFRGKHRLVR
ncbi:VWA domain-containing protein [Mariniblastus sp.]|nr:VWA domain-containing protein [Mariniblastus sp.]MDB4670921.1 VWA domain-containing protein [Pirellulaceae bacterium]MDB4756684.1 VWA domain-containing protein [Mariniblastus sp.]